MERPAVCFSALMCHAPIVQPAVAGPEAARCRRTTRAMREVAARAVASAPDRLVLVSPHSPRRRGAWGAWVGPHKGDLGRFRAPQLAVSLPDAPEVAEALGLGGISGEPLDHGAMVPLSFLWEAGWRGPTSILALPWGPADGQAVGRALAALPGRTAVIASGDMSHRLKPGAPAGFHPQAKDFDAAFVAALRAEDWAAALAPPHREEAAEDVVDATAVALGAVDGPLHAEVLSYEGPWGVGYTEAVFYDPAPPLYAVARAAIRAELAGTPYAPPEGGQPPKGAFVTLHLEGRLRGCIGRMAPSSERSLYELVAQVAVESAFKDPRFPALRAEELPDVQLEVSVLEPPEPVAGGEALDARRYGVLVSAGRRRGVLLPDLDGVDTPAQQLQICRRKAGIPADAPVTLQRFEVTKTQQPWA